MKSQTIGLCWHKVSRGKTARFTLSKIVKFKAKYCLVSAIVKSTYLNSYRLPPLNRGTEITATKNGCHPIRIAHRVDALRGV